MNSFGSPWEGWKGGGSRVYRAHGLRLSGLGCRIQGNCWCVEVLDVSAEEFV